MKYYIKHSIFVHILCKSIHSIKMRHEDVTLLGNKDSSRIFKIEIFVLSWVLRFEQIAQSIVLPHKQRMHSRQTRHLTSSNISSNFFLDFVINWKYRKGIVVSNLQFSRAIISSEFIRRIVIRSVNIGCINESCDC